MITRLARWWLSRADRRRAAAAPAPERFLECTTLGCTTNATHTIVAEIADGVEGEAGGGGGGTGMSADYCPDHCPGGCQSGCATMTG